jgi:phytoene desaturase
MASKTTLIVGAGIGGLACSIRLAVAGYNVTVFEKNAQVGGKMYQLERGGYRWDTGPSVITMRHVLEDLFYVAGKKLDDYLTLLPLNPLTRYFYPDGTVLDAAPDFATMANNIAQVDERDVEGYFNYLAYAARIHRITGPVFIYDKPPTPRSFLRVPVTEWLHADPLRTMNQAINAHVRSPKLRQMLGRFATYVGGSPYEAPATLNVIAHVELTGGVWYPQGGIYQIAKALQTLAQEVGVTICTNSPIAEITTHNGTATGVRLQDGTTHTANVVVANADVTTTMNQLLSPSVTNPRTRQRLSDYEPSCSGFVMMLGVKRQFDNLAHHNILFSKDYRAEFDAIFKRGVMPDDPTIYVCITSKTDAAHAPTNSENWFILVNAPALSDKFDWGKETQNVRNQVLEKLGKHGFDVRPHIEQEILWTPHDLQHHSGAWRGALYGPSANSKFTVFRRPHNRSRDLKNLYFVGGTTHPGGGVPMVMLSGKVVAEMVQDDHR